MGNSALVPGYPAISAPTQPTVDPASGGAFPVSVNAALLGAAAATYTFADTSITTGNVFTFVINGHSNTYTVVSGDTTLAILVGHIEGAINADSTDNLIVVATVASPVVTVTALSKGTVGCYSFAGSWEGGATESVVVSNPTLVLGGGNTIVPKYTFTWNFGNGNVLTFYEGYAYNLDLATALAMRAGGYSY